MPVAREPTLDISVPADALTPNGARLSADAVLTTKIDFTLFRSLLLSSLNTPLLIRQFSKWPPQKKKKKKNRVAFWVSTFIQI